MKIIGIDVSKDKLDCACSIHDNKLKTKSFHNNSSGWQELLGWAKQNADDLNGQCHFIMEATGVYHEQLAIHLHNSGNNVSVVNPAHVKFYAQSLGVRSKNDKKDSVVLMRYGMKENPKLWQPEPEKIRVLKALIGRFGAIEKDLQREMNRQEKAIANCAPDEVVESLTKMVNLLESELKHLEQLIEKHIDDHPELKANKALLQSIPGVGKVVATRMLFVLSSHQFESASQCAAFLGLVPVLHESGSSVRGRPRLSKIGNPVIRAKLYMATVTAIRYNPDLRISMNV